MPSSDRRSSAGTPSVLSSDAIACVSSASRARLRNSFTISSSNSSIEASSLVGTYAISSIVEKPSCTRIVATSASTSRLFMNISRSACDSASLFCSACCSLMMLSFQPVSFTGRDEEVTPERRAAQRYVFRPTTYACVIDPDFVLSEERFPRLASEKPLDEKVRRRAESVIAATFERVGELHTGHGYSANFADLLAAVNIERPFSAAYLRQVLDQDESGAFAVDPDGDDVYTYVPGNPV